MKLTIPVLNISLALLVFVFFANCTGAKKEDTADDHHHTAAPEAATDSTSETSTPRFEVSESFQEQLGYFFTAYLSLKDAFTNSDMENIKSGATAASNALDRVDMTLLTGPAHNDWMAYLSPMRNSIKEIENSADIEVQRKAFSTLSDNLYNSIKAFGLGGMEAFYEFCPMAFNSKGAYWLSDSEEIRNPYFGEKMLTCGSVEEKLK